MGGGQCAVGSVQWAVCSGRCAVGGVQCAVGGVQWAVGGGGGRWAAGSDVGVCDAEPLGQCKESCSGYYAEKVYSRAL